MQMLQAVYFVRASQLTTSGGGKWRRTSAVLRAMSPALKLLHLLEPTVCGV